MPTEALAEASPKPKTFPGRSVNSNIPLSATVTDSPGGFREGGQGTQHTRVILTREAQSRAVWCRQQPPVLMSGAAEASLWGQRPSSPAPATPRINSAVGAPKPGLEARCPKVASQAADEDTPRLPATQESRMRLFPDQSRDTADRDVQCRVPGLYHIPLWVTWLTKLI